MSDKFKSNREIQIYAAQQLRRACCYLEVVKRMETDSDNKHTLDLEIKSFIKSAEALEDILELTPLERAMQNVKFGAPGSFA